MNIAILFNLADRTKIGVLSDLKCEQEIRIIVPLVEGILRRQGHSVSSFPCDLSIWERLKELRGSIDLVFNLAEAFGGTNADEPLIPAMLEALDIPFTGASSANMQLTLDKEKTKLVARAYGVPTTPYAIVRDRRHFHTDLEFPLIVKPIRQEASIGIYFDSVVGNEAELNKKVVHVLAAYKQPAIVEPFIFGREISVGCLGNDSDLMAFPPLEFLFPQAQSPENAFRSYEYKWGGAKEIMVHAELDPELERQLIEYAKTMFVATECRDYARMDFRVTNDREIYFLEVNYNPGVGPNTHGLNNTLTMMASFVEIEFEELICRIVSVARSRY